MTQVDPGIAELAREVAKLKRQVRHLSRASQGGFRSVEIADGTPVYYDDDGVARIRVGVQSDGTVTAQDVNAGTPPTPTAPDVISEQNGIRITWDGTFVDSNWTADMAYVEVHVGDAPGFEATDLTQVTAFTSDNGGSYFFPLPPYEGSRWVALVAVNTSGNESPKSEEIEGEGGNLASNVEGEARVEIVPSGSAQDIKVYTGHADEVTPGSIGTAIGGFGGEADRLSTVIYSPTTTGSASPAVIVLGTDADENDREITLYAIGGSIHARGTLISSILKIGVLGREIYHLDYGHMDASGATDANSRVTVNCNTDGTPAAVFLTAGAGSAKQYSVFSRGYETFEVTVRDGSGTLVGSGADVDFFWVALVEVPG